MNEEFYPSRVYHGQDQDEGGVYRHFLELADAFHNRIRLYFNDTHDCRMLDRLACSAMEISVALCGTQEERNCCPED